MPVNPFHHAEPGPFQQWAVRLALSVAGVVAGTVAGFAVAGLVRRPRHSGQPPMELAPADTAIDFDKGGVWLQRDSDEDHRGAGADAAVDGIAGGLPAAGMRPTFEVAAELARELDDGAARADAGIAPATEGGADLPLDAGRETVPAR
jgi:hypothetical protein